MKIMCVGVTLYLCLVSSLALPGSPKSKDDDKRNLKLLYRFLQFLAAEKGIMDSGVNCYLNSYECKGHFVSAQNEIDCCLHVRGLSYRDTRDGSWPCNACDDLAEK